MADTKTAAEWQAVLDKAKSEQADAKQAAQDAFAAAFQANANVESARLAVDQEVAANGGKLPFFSTAYSNYKKALEDQSAKAAANETAQSNLSNVNATVEQASQSLAIAQSAPADATSSTPDPTGVVVGGALPQNASVVNTQQLDNGSDPYVSNGQSTISSEETQLNPKNVSPEEDPFEAARLSAAAEDNPSPTEQTVINANQDAKLSQEEQGQLREFQENQRAALKAESDAAGNVEGNWTASSVDQVRTKQTIAVSRNTVQKDDWRVRLSLAPGATYLYGAATPGQLLYPLKATDGVIFPYTPQVQTSYRANYDTADLTHSNYKMYFYKNSNVDEIQVTADFTAQDNTEANYLLAVIHFFKSVTKMFYGQDGSTGGPKAGTPPPLCYLNGFGQYQFNEHPVLITNFQYSLPTDVDYIRAGSPTVAPGTSTSSYQSKPKPQGFDLMKLLRLSSNRLGKGKGATDASAKNYSNQDATYVPTKMQIQLSMIPIVTRNDISNNFSLEKYATGELLKGKQRSSGGGIW